ncbi:hypothetical protein SARC_12955, partial [Sphaeroforma arctica JP610]
FNALQAMTNVELEHPALSQLHQLLVVEENYQASEALLRQMAAENIFEQYIQKVSVCKQYMKKVSVFKQDMEKVSVCKQYIKKVSVCKQ